MNSKPSKANYLTAVFAAILFIVGTYYFAWERYDVRDMDAAGAYVCMVSMLCCIIVFSTKNLAFAKKVLLGIGAANILSLFFLWLEDDLSLTYEGLHVFIMMLAMAPIYLGFYFWMTKKEKELEKQKAQELRLQEARKKADKEKAV